MSDGQLYAIFTVGNAPTDKKKRGQPRKHTEEERILLQRKMALDYYERNREKCIQKSSERARLKRLETGVPVRKYRKRNQPTENNLAETENKQET
jgi:hypothetical protein